MPAAQDKAVIEKFVELVKNNPVLYDASMPEHKDAHLLYSIWASIAEIMGNSSMNGEMWKKKWINLRDTYTKRKRERAKSGQAATNKKPWVFFHMLSFLDGFIEQKNKDSSFPSHLSQDDEDNDTVWMESLSDDERLSVASGSSHRTREEQWSGSSRTVYSPVSQERPHVRKFSKKRPREAVSNVDIALRELVDDVKRNCAADNKVVEQDPDGDKAFFESCSRRMTKFSAQTRSFLKLQISQLFFNAENPALSPMSITPLPDSNCQPVTTSSLPHIHTHMSTTCTQTSQTQATSFDSLPRW